MREDENNNNNKNKKNMTTIDNTAVDDIKIVDMSIRQDDDDESIRTDAKTYIGTTEATINDEIEDESTITIPITKAPAPANTNASMPSIAAPLATVKQVGHDENLKSVTHSWSQPGGEVFQVRGKTYLGDSVKYHSQGQIFQTRGVDLILTTEFGPANIGRNSSVLNGKLREKPTFIINFRFPWGVLVFYHEIPEKYLPILRQKHDPSGTSMDDFITADDFLKDNNSPHDRALYNFIMGDDTYRNSKLKLIPKVVEGNIIVRKLVKGKPVIMGKKLPISYVYQPANVKEGKAEYWEADLDIGSSSATAKKIVSVCKKYMTSLTIDLGFVIEGDLESELPERILTSTRIHHFDTKLSPMLRWV